MPAFESTFFTDIGPALRFLRLHGTPAPVKQKEVAARAGVTKGMLSSYERSKQEPSLGTLGRLLAALGADLVKLQWALRMVATLPGADPGTAVPAPGEEGTDDAPAAPMPFPSRWRDSEVAESAAPYGTYRVVRVPEPLSDDEEHALGQMLAGFLAYLRYTRPEPRDGNLPSAGGDPAD
jgi:transcriptional regulator with XRE-family HTH domain